MKKQAFHTRGRIQPRAKLSQIAQQLRAPCLTGFRQLLRGPCSCNRLAHILCCNHAGSIKGSYEKIFLFFSWGCLTALRELRGAQSHSFLSGMALKPNFILKWGGNTMPLSDLRFCLTFGPTFWKKVTCMQTEMQHLVWVHNVNLLLPKTKEQKLKCKIEIKTRCEYFFYSLV